MSKDYLNEFEEPEPVIESLWIIVPLRIIGFCAIYYGIFRYIIHTLK